MPHKQLKSIPRRLGYILGAQWTRDLSWTIFTILLAWHSKEMLGQIMLALSYGYLVKTAADVGLNDFLLSTFVRKDADPMRLLGEVTWFKFTLLMVTLCVTFGIVSWQNYTPELSVVVMCIAAGFGLDGVSDSFFALCQARGRQDVEMRIRIPAALIGIGYGIACVLLGAPIIAIAAFKPIESVLLMAFALKAMGRNPLRHFGWDQMKDLLKQLKVGFIFTGMAGCAMLYNKLNVFFLKKRRGCGLLQRLLGDCGRREHTRFLCAPRQGYLSAAGQVLAGKQTGLQTAGRSDGPIPVGCLTASHFSHIC